MNQATRDECIRYTVQGWDAAAQQTLSMTSRNASRCGMGMNQEITLVRYASTTPTAGGMHDVPICQM